MCVTSHGRFTYEEEEPGWITLVEMGVRPWGMATSELYFKMRAYKFSYMSTRV